MASAPESVKQFEEAKLFAASPALTARRLRETTSLGSALWPASGKGGGSGAPQVEVGDLRNFLLAQAAPLPIDAANAVLALRDLPKKEVETFVKENNAGFATVLCKPLVVYLGEIHGDTLGEFLDALISQAVLPDPALDKLLASVAGFNWTLTLCTDPAFASISQRCGGHIDTVTFGREMFDDQAEIQTQRLVSLPYKAIMIAAQLWRDTLERRGQPIAVPEPIAKTENAGTPDRVPALDQPTKHTEDRSEPNSPDFTPRVCVVSTPENDTATEIEVCRRKTLARA